MHISPDTMILWQINGIALNATIAYTWLVMLVIVLTAWWVTRKLSTGTHLSRSQNLLEVLVMGIRDQIQQASGQNPDRYLPFIGTLFIFIAMSNLLAVVPGYHPPTSSLSTTAALAICVFIAVPLYGIRRQGLLGYLKEYIQPTPIMLPFHVIGELTRTLSLAVRLFGNVMSGALIGAILLSLAPFIFPVFMQAMELLTGIIQAYVFAILAMVYIASATEAHEKTVTAAPTEQRNHTHG